MPNEKLHLAIIPDGNRRWARAQGLHPWKGHERAVEGFRSLTEWCRSHPEIGILTVFCFSTENWKRDKKEIEVLMNILETYLQKERKGFLEKKTRLVHSGRKDRIPTRLAKLIADVEEETRDQTGFTLHLAIDYGGKDEILRAVQKLQTSKQANKQTSKPDDPLRVYLDHPELPDIDLILRSSGEHRTSNFFLWQSTYAEWIFTEKFFPDITTEDLKAALKEFRDRKRRFGS